MTHFYATTRFFQGNQEFWCTWDLTAANKNPTNEETIEHLAAMLDENSPDTWSLDEEEEPLPTSLDLFGLSPADFARELVLNEKQAEERFGVTWEISTLWEEVDPDNWEHPCNL